jgi:hypothetical protein
MVQQIRDARIKVTVDTEEAKRDIDLLRKSIGKETVSVGHIKKETKTTEKKLDSIMKGAQKAKNKIARGARFLGYRGMRLPDIYQAGINTIAGAAAASVNWIPVAGPPLGSLFRSFTQAAIPFAEYGGTFVGEMMKGMVDTSEGDMKSMWDKIPDAAKTMLPGFGINIPISLDVAVHVMAQQVKLMAAQLTKVRIAQADMEMMLKNVGQMVQTDLGINSFDLSPEFLKNALAVEWRAAHATNSFRMSLEKNMRGKMGGNAAEWLKKWLNSNMQRGQ